MKDIFIVTGRPVHALGPSPAEVLTYFGGSRFGDPPKAEFGSRIELKL